jgi:hypothetical protein
VGRFLESFARFSLRRRATASSSTAHPKSRGRRWKVKSNTQGVFPSTRGRGPTDCPNVPGKAKEHRTVVGNSVPCSSSLGEGYWKPFWNTQLELKTM